MARCRSPGLTRSVTLMEGEGDSPTAILPDEVLLMIFRFLHWNELLTAEQVCLRWKAVANTCFATTKTLKLWYQRDLNGLQRMRRCGASLKSLELTVGYTSVDWINKIVNSFPNLLAIRLGCIPISNEYFTVLAVKCCRLTRIYLDNCDLNDEKIGILLKGFPRLKVFKLVCIHDVIGECFRELGSNLQHLRLANFKTTPAGTSHIFTRGINLKSIYVGTWSQCDASSFTTFCTKSPLRSLKMKYVYVSKEAFLAISHLSLLERLVLHNCPEVDSDVLIGISRGCPNLKDVSLQSLSLVCVRGVKALAKCRHLTRFSISFMTNVTDEYLVEIAKSGLLKSLVIFDCAVTDRGVSAILAQCPHLEYLFVSECSGVGDSTVDTAIEAVESRARSATLDRHPRVRYIKGYKGLQRSHHLLWVTMSGEGLNRYKGGFSHPLLYFQLWRWFIMDGDDSASINKLPDEVLLMVFRFLKVDHLLKAEQVCVRWKSIVDTCFATAKTLDLGLLRGLDALNHMRRHGPSLKTLKTYYDNEAKGIRWIPEIVVFPNLSSITLRNIQIEDNEMQDLAGKCSQLVSITLLRCSFTDKGMGFLLRGLPRLNYLKANFCTTTLGECFSELGTDLESLVLVTSVEVTKAGASHIFSRCTNLKSLAVGSRFQCDDPYDFSMFCKKNPLRKLYIYESKWSKNMFSHIPRLPLLEILVLKGCPEVDSDVLISISLGCPNLRHISLGYLPLVCDLGVKSLAKCTNLNALACTRIEKMTDDSLLELAKLGSLMQLSITDCKISDVGLSAILVRCVHLGRLDINRCGGVGDGTVDAAIQAVESRGYFCAISNQAPPRSRYTVMTSRLGSCREVFPRSTFHWCHT